MHTINSFSVLTELWSTIRPCFTIGFSMQILFPENIATTIGQVLYAENQPSIHSQKLSIRDIKLIESNPLEILIKLPTA